MFTIRRQLLLGRKDLSNAMAPSSLFRLALTISRLSFTLSFAADPPHISRDEKTQLESITQSLRRYTAEADHPPQLEAALLAAYVSPDARPAALVATMQSFAAKKKAGPRGLLARLYDEQKRVSEYVVSYEKQSVEGVKALRHCLSRSPPTPGLSSASSSIPPIRMAKRHKTEAATTAADGEQRVGGVRLFPFLSRRQLLELQRFIECAARATPGAVHQRNFGDGNYGNGQKAIMLQLFFRILLPDVYDRILNAAQRAVGEAGWPVDVVNGTGRLGVRCVEYLDYVMEGGLGWHRDTDSIYTMSIMLSEPGEFSGGELHMYLPSNTADSYNANGTARDVYSSGMSSQPGTAYIFPSNEVPTLYSIITICGRITLDSTTSLPTRSTG